MTTYCHIGMGRLGIAVANAIMLLQKGNEHYFYEPLDAAREVAYVGEFSEMRMVAGATGNIAGYKEGIPSVDEYIITAGKPRTSPDQDKGALLRENAEILAPLMKQIPKGSKVWIATNPPILLCGRFKGWSPVPLRSCTDNLRKRVWGDDWVAANDAMLAAKGYTSYGPAVAIAKEVLGL